MSCQKCGRENMFGWDLICPDCAEIEGNQTDYEWDEETDRITCHNCGNTESWTDPRSFVSEENKDTLLWKCPHCHHVYDLSE
jgi:DNA-directed RNA polymerase subunit RPC12/RpoP